MDELMAISDECLVSYSFFWLMVSRDGPWYPSFWCLFNGNQELLFLKFWFLYVFVLFLSSMSSAEFPGFRFLFQAFCYSEMVGPPGVVLFVGLLWASFDHLLFFFSIFFPAMLESCEKLNFWGLEFVFLNQMIGLTIIWVFGRGISRKVSIFGSLGATLSAGLCFFFLGFLYYVSELEFLFSLFVFPLKNASSC